MATPNEKEIQTPISDLPDRKDKDASRIAAEIAENVKGGRMTRGGDDDLDDLEVER